VTCNWDGRSKHETVIGDDAYIGSDTMLVAPVTLGARAATGAGSVVTKDVPEDALAVGAPARLLRGRGDKMRRKARPAESDER
jgi:bifunctional UDP-N-acetylglucosamine pyrophosphorylase/glucosamine-1-phosphate N-acetyltransferase